VTDARETLEQLTLELKRHFGSELLGLYLFGSLASGGFRPGKSDLDLIAILKTDVDEEQLEALKGLHAGFVSERPEWVERVEVRYASRDVLQTLAGRPSGLVAVTSPGEPLGLKDAGFDWTLNWHDVCTHGETLLGPPPLELGPEVTREAYEQAVRAGLGEWATAVREPWVAYVPAHQAYAVITICRALHLLATGERATKEKAAAWGAETYPDWAPLIRGAWTTYNADVREPHRALVAFTDHAVTEAERL
jgi:Domain of unknown function (DUF4111)/Nucleotidyltransferase domain